MTFDDARRAEGRGGWRPGAGRPRGRTKVAHAKRQAVVARAPLHVTLRVAQGVPSLRRAVAFAAIRDAIRGGNRADFRVVHFHVLVNHVHLLVEANDSRAMQVGMQGLCVRLARNCNRVLGRAGTLFAERYHARALRTPTEVRNALRYVLLNSDRHAKPDRRRFDVDPCSSGVWFDGWSDDRWQFAAPMPIVTAPPKTWLLREGWRKAGGPIAFDDTPGGNSAQNQSSDRVPAARHVAVR